MGYPYNELIAPAVLYNHPGLSKEEFVDELDKTHSSTLTEFKDEDSWGSFDTKDEQEHRLYHRGLLGLPEILGLDITPAFMQFQTLSFDEYGLPLSPPSLFQLTRKVQRETGLKFEVSTHSENILMRSKIVREYAWNKLKEGGVWEDLNGMERGKVIKIYEDSSIKGESSQEGPDDADEDGPKYNYKMKIRPFEPIYRIERFNDETTLFASYPQFAPDNQYDFSQKAGRFGGAPGLDKFWWINIDGKYYLDPKTFDLIPPAGSVLNYGYTDLIITSAAIAHGAWKLLSYKGLKHLEAFFKDFPDAEKRHERAVWDSFTWDYAKKRGMTNYELLRFRLDPGYLPEDFPNEVLPENLRDRRDSNPQPLP